MALRVRIYQPSGGGGGGSYVLPIAQPGTLGGIRPDDVTLVVDPVTGIASAIGGGTGTIEGIVDVYADLPVDGTATLDSFWIVRESSGVWFISRKQRGIYQRIATTGTRDTDWEYLGEWLEEFADTIFRVYNSTDNTKQLAFSLGGLTTGTTRTLTVPDASGTLVLTTLAQTLTNKTLTAPAISSPTGIVKGDVGLPNVDNTSNATERAATATLTNKTISGATNTVNNLPVASMVMNTARLLGRSTGGSGVVEEIVLGTNLSFTGTTLNAAGGGGGGGGTKTMFRFTSLDGQPPATNYATRDTRNSLSILDFDDTTDEAVRFIGVVPEGASLASGMTVRLKIGATTATSGAARFGARFAKLDQDVDGLTFDTAVEANLTISGTSGVFTWLSLTPITTLDSIAAGDAFVVEIYRAASNGGDTMVGDAELIAVEGQAI